jgi:DegV family protein with EDD domain
LSEEIDALATALAAGYAALVVHVDLLDAINVFPVADGDTGSNLRVSLKPLAEPPSLWPDDKKILAEALMRSACGNSGNIAAAFFSELARAKTLDDLPERADNGAAKAHRAVAEPKAGTMLDVFAALPALLRDHPLSAAHCPALLAALAENIRKGAALLPQLRAARVADSGAVAMYIFFTGFFRNLTSDVSVETPLAVALPDLLHVADGYQPAATIGFCVDALLDTGGAWPEPEALAALGDSLVVLPQGNCLKLHVHSDDPAVLRSRLATIGSILFWRDSPLNSQQNSSCIASLSDGNASGNASSSPASIQTPVRVITDAAGSLPHSLAEKEGIILFDNIIVMAGQAYTEGEVAPVELYRRMCAGEKVGTAQAARMEWDKRLSVCRRAGPSLYLAVGSAYTGNYLLASQWQKNNPAGTPLAVVDSGAASGRLALIAIFTARYAARGEGVASIAEYARRCGAACQEFLFIDTLTFLAAGGRVSRAGEFVGNVLGLKPIISPMPDGVRRLGLVRGRGGQLAFLKRRLTEQLAEQPTEEGRPGQALILLQYTDNQDWLTATLPPLIKLFYPQAEIHILPLSLTTGAHVGPGSWSVALGYPPVAMVAEEP